MKITGIIAEYNPFHKGHQYQIDTLRSQYHPDYVIIAMSGDFVQRGTPALMDKYSRAHMALLQGADLVLELPAWFSTASAEAFARGGILLFLTTGITDSLCFGAETDDLSRLQKLAGLLNEEPDRYRSLLASYLRQGFSFPAARAKALPEYAPLLETPNNILALEYLKSIASLAPAMTPLLIRRKGGDYHDRDLSAPLASASAIRSALLASYQADRSGWYKKELDDALPRSSCRIMEEYQQSAAFLWENDFSLLLHQALLSQTPETLLKYLDMTEALANRLISKRESFLSWSSFCELCDTKDITYARISRILTHLLLDIRAEMLSPFLDGSCSALPYLRILGFRRDAVPLLTELKKKAAAPLITSPADTKVLSEAGLSMLKTDLYASDLYRSVLTARTGRRYPGEYKRRLLIV